jgi:prepilin-type N-terminal cleavage/methylation domain-containing protein
MFTSPLNFNGAGKRKGFTLVEVLITSAIALLLGAAVVIFYSYSSRAFVTIDDYNDLCERSQLALDKMSKDIRQSKQLTAYATNSLTFSDVNGNPLQYTYDPAAKTLVRASGGQTATYLTNCDSLQFWIYQPTPTSNSFACYSPAYVTNARVIQITWKCSRRIMGRKTTTESIESAEIVMRNH